MSLPLLCQILPDDLAAAAAAAAATATGAAAVDLTEQSEKEALLAFREAVTDPDQVLLSWQRSSHP